MSRKRGHPPADSDGLRNAAVWLLYLDHETIRVNFITEVATRLLASKVPAVQSVVGASGYNRLRTRLARHRDAVLTPDWDALATAILWAEKAGLPVIPMKKIAELPRAGPVARALPRLPRFERDVWTLAFAVGRQADTLPDAALEPLRRIVLHLLRQMMQLIPDD